MKTIKVVEPSDFESIRIKMEILLKEFNSLTVGVISTKEVKQQVKKSYVKKNTKRINNYFLGGQSASPELNERALSALRELTTNIDPRVLGKKIGFAGIGTINGIFKIGKMKERSANAILDYYSRMNNRSLVDAKQSS